VVTHLDGRKVFIDNVVITHRLNSGTSWAVIQCEKGMMKINQSSIAVLGRNSLRKKVSDS
jgi:hypothetical protein